MAAPRFRKGTNDQDGDGEKGGSISQTEANRRASGDSRMAKTQSKRTAAAREQKAANEAEALAMTAAPDPQTGQSMTRPGDKPSRKQVETARKSALEEQFAAADEKGAASLEDIRDATLSRAIRGY